MIKNWKTSLGGWILALGILAGPVIEKRAPSIQEIITIGGAIGLGAAAKDKDVTGVGLAATRKR